MDESIQKHLTPTLDESHTLLLKAAGLIESHGWCQGAYDQPDGRMCIVGATWKAATGSSKPQYDRIGPVDEACIAMSNRLGQVVHHWNDEPGRTQDEVVAKMRAVALGL